MNDLTLQERLPLPETLSTKASTGVAEIARVLAGDIQAPLEHPGTGRWSWRSLPR